MQNKGPIRLFLIILGIVCVYQLFFTWKAKSVDRIADEYAVAQADKVDYPTTSARDSAVKKMRQYYFDSTASDPVINLGIGSWRPIQYTYSEIKNNELKLGLDLQGGVSVILEVSVEDVVKGLANNTTDPTFNKALIAAREQSGGKEDFVTVFFRKFDEIAKADGSGVTLSSPQIFGSLASATGGAKLTDDQVKEIVRKEVDGAVDRAYKILRTRIDKFGVSSPTIQRLPGTDQISVELAGVSDAERVRKLLQSSAALEFWTVYTPEEVAPFLIDLNARLKEINDLNAKVQQEEAPAKQVAGESSAEDLLAEPSEGNKITKGNADSLKAAAEKLLEQADQAIAQASGDSVRRGENPLFDVLYPVQQGVAIIAYVPIKDTTVVNKYLASAPDLLIRHGMQHVQFMWGNKPPVQDKTVMELYAIRSNSKGEPILSGDVISDASQGYDQRSRPCVNMVMDATGADRWAKLTGDNIGKAIAIVLDGTVYSAPTVQGAIPGGRSEITGQFDVKEAQDLANILKAGRLPAPTHIIQSEVVGPSLGREAIESSMISFIIAFIAVLAWMIFFYNRSGFYADIALFVNILFIFGILASLGATLTLPGFAGIILTIGMAVDANVIINERIKEELRAGKTGKQAVADGYKHALPSIIDSQSTTFLTSFILFIFGKGPIQGFATTMMIGIITSVITSIFISRMLIDRDVKRGRPLRVYTSLSKNFFANTNFQFIQKKNLFYGVSLVLIVVSFLAMGIRGFDKSIDFVGGRTYTVRFDQPVVTAEVAKSLQEVLVEDGQHELPEVKTFGTDRQVKISTKFMSQKTGHEVDDMVDRTMYEGLKKFFPEGFTYEEFTSGSGLGIMEANVVGPTMADDIKTSTVWALVFSLAGIFLYILFRFRKWQYSAGCVAASIHNVVVVCGAFALLHGVLPFSMQIDQTFVAAILTVIGYALNDNVIVFDRIREEIRNNPRKDVDMLSNMAINKTLSRTINTSLTTFLVVLVIFIWGGDSIRGFMFAIGIGIIIGTYSSIFTATPVMLDLLRFSKDREKALQQK